MKRDPNNFISVIVNKITLARHFKQRVALSITSKTLLKSINVKFYIRKRYQRLYLYTRVTKESFGNNKNQLDFLNDLILLVPELQLESTQGHYNGLILDVTDDNESLYNYLKLISYLSRPKDFYKRVYKVYTSLYNYQNKSLTPVHIQITNTKVNQLRCIDIINSIKDTGEFNDKIANSNTTNVNDDSSSSGDESSGAGQVN